MKKTIFTIAILSAALSASAIEVGVYGGGTLNSVDRAYGGVSVGQKFGDYTLTGSVDRAYVRQNDQTRYSVIGSYEFVKLGSVGFNAQVGGSYIDNQVSRNGYSLVTGLGATVPVTSNITAFAEVRNQRAIQGRVNPNNGNSVNAGLKYSF